MMTTHRLKILPEYLAPKMAGKKMFEIRNDDRNFRVGDEAIYTVYDNGITYEHVFVICYVTNYMQTSGYVVFGERFVETREVF